MLIDPQNALSVSIDALVELQLDQSFPAQLQTIERQILAAKENLEVVRKDRQSLLKLPNSDQSLF